MMGTASSTIEICAVNDAGHAVPTGIVWSGVTPHITWCKFNEIKRCHRIGGMYPFDLAYWNSRGEFVESFGINEDSFKMITGKDAESYDTYLKRFIDSLPTTALTLDLTPIDNAPYDGATNE